jgi:hypothetical protein
VIGTEQGRNDRCGGGVELQEEIIEGGEVLWCEHGLLYPVAAQM